MFSSSMCGKQVVIQTPASARPVTSFRLSIDAAHKKGAGSTKNGRDSQPKRRGVKVYGDQPVDAGGIIVRQVGTKFHPGVNVGLGKDFTLYSTIEGIVKFEMSKGKKCVSVYPAELSVDPNPPGRADGKPTRRERRLTQYKPRSAVLEQLIAAAVANAAQ